MPTHKEVGVSLLLEFCLSKWTSGVPWRPGTPNAASKGASKSWDPKSWVQLAGWVGGWGDWEEGAPNHSLAGMCEIFQGRGCEPRSPGACQSPWDQPSELTPKGLRADPARFWEVFLRATYAQTYAQGVPTKNRFRGAKEN